MNNANSLLKDRHSLTAEDRFEIGENRLDYGLVKLAKWERDAPQEKSPALKAFADAKKAFEDSKLPDAANRIAEISQHVARLNDKG